jgi:hypothetical protein
VDTQQLIKELRRDLARRKRERKEAADQNHHALASWLDGYITACEIILMRLTGQKDKK